MTTPGTVVTVTESSTPNNTPSNLGTFFAIGQASRGAVGVANQVNSLAQYINLYGNRTDNGVSATLYDTMDVYFQEGGQYAWVSRVSGSGATTASHTLMDQAGTPLSTLVVSALGPGTWGNSVTVAVTTGSVSNTFVITIVNGSTTLEVSPNLTSPVDAVNWAASYSQTVTIANSGSVTAAPNNNPANVSAVALSGGTDDLSPADAQWTAALGAFTLALGPGQVAAPGRITPVVWEGLVAHAQTFNRFALLDGENVSTESTIAADAGTVRAASVDPSYGFMLAPWVTYSGPPTGTATPAYPRTVPPSALVAGLIARSDGAGNNGDTAAAGNNGIARNALGVTQSFNDANRGLLDAAGVGVIRNYRNRIQLYGYTGLAADLNWSDVGNVRLRMQIVDQAHIIGDGFVFADINGAGHTASAFGGQLSAFLLSLYNQGALFGLTPADAFTVNVGPTINTPATAQLRELIAQINVRMSPTAEQVLINVTRYPVIQSLPV